MEPTRCSEMQANKNNAPSNNPKSWISQTGHFCVYAVSYASTTLSGAILVPIKSTTEGTMFSAAVTQDTMVVLTPCCHWQFSRLVSSPHPGRLLLFILYCRKFGFADGVDPSRIKLILVTCYSNSITRQTMYV
jgi:hypothetical protein